jgi:hypothetical protein
MARAIEPVVDRPDDQHDAGHDAVLIDRPPRRLPIAAEAA